MIDRPTKYYFRQRHQNRLYDVVIRAIEESGLRRKDIAAAIGVPPSQVTRLLSGPGNWTNDTTSDLLYAIEAELDFHVAFLRDRVKSNTFHPVGESLKPTKLITGTGTTSSVSVLIIAPSHPAPNTTWTINQPLAWTNA